MQAKQAKGAKQAKHAQYSTVEHRTAQQHFTYPPSDPLFDVLHFNLVFLEPFVYTWAVETMSARQLSNHIAVTKLR